LGFLGISTLHPHPNAKYLFIVPFRCRPEEGRILPKAWSDWQAGASVRGVFDRVDAQQLSARHSTHAADHLVSSRGAGVSTKAPGRFLKHQRW
jgi:hypothetical protein